MNILVLGGSQFVGRHIVEALLASGHTVTTLNRGRSSDALPASVERLRGDRDDPAGLEALADRSWDACVDVSGYTPRQVQPAALALHGCVGRYVFISAVSVYGDPVQGPVTEACPLLPPADPGVTHVDGETYGPLKVACEEIARSVHGERSTILRPQVIAGPHDPTGRYPYWAERAMRGDEMLAPGDGNDHLQVIDARDLSRFVVRVIERDVGGTFNLAGPRLTWSEFMRILGARNLVWVHADLIESAGVTFVQLPLFRPEQGARSSLMHVSNERARAAGLTLTDSRTTADDTSAWIRTTRIEPALSAGQERELIALARGSR